MRIGKEFLISVLEIIAFITSLIGVILGVLGPRTTWPWWAVSSLLYAVLFYQSAYYASSALQLIFIAGGVLGWFGWGITGAKPRKSNSKERILIFIFLSASSLALWPILTRIGAASSAIEAFGFVGSVIAQLLMIWQRFEAWPLWLVVDAAYTYQYFKGQLFLTGALYVIFSLVAIWGWIRWHRESKKFIND
jgi:nicotinamide mononucleotide transporter